KYSEREHLAVMEEVERSWPMEKIPDEILFPSFRLVQETYDKVTDLLGRTEAGELTEREIFVTAIELEQSLVE
ncbi:MAG: hypothetical protein GWN58_17965, partial [Anaerolineae bacterium]|nr:hypothetical protein [Anaerolineae bacterium]